MIRDREGCWLVGIHEVGDAGTTSGIQAYRLAAKLLAVLSFASINPPRL